MRIFWFIGFSLLASACAAAPVRAPIGSTLDLPRAEPPKQAPAKALVPDDIVARSAQPFRAQRMSDGQSLEQGQLLDELSHFDVVCLGEAHDAARDHFAELAITEGLERRARVSGRALGVGFEMFQASDAGALHAYGIGHLGEAGLRKRTHYEERWGYAYAYYRPILAFGRAYRLPLKALNATRELTHAVAENGLSRLTPRLRRQLPAELNFDDAQHRAEFEHLMTDHPRGPEGSLDLDNFYAAQVVWDETMADNAARWVAARAPLRQLIVLAGTAHCQRPAIPARIERREALRVANVRLSTRAASDANGFAYTLLFDGS